MLIRQMRSQPHSCTWSNDPLPGLFLQDLSTGFDTFNRYSSRFYCIQFAARACVMGWAFWTSPLSLSLFSDFSTLPWSLAFFSVHKDIPNVLTNTHIFKCYIRAVSPTLPLSLKCLPYISSKHVQLWNYRNLVCKEPHLASAIVLIFKLVEEGRRAKEPSVCQRWILINNWNTGCVRTA